jgi:archaellum component FlaG (FlaF/FlaG flagellin family)
MASEAVSSMILFIGAVAAAGAVAVALGVTTAHYTTGLRDRTSHIESELSTRIAIVNDPAHVPNNPVILYVKNTGSTDLTLADFVILYDGTQRTGWTVTVGGVADTTLEPSETAVITVTGLSASNGNHAIRVVSGPGYSDDLEFNT